MRGPRRYGPKSNDELLQLFGFVEEENPHDTFLSIGLEDYLLSGPAGLYSAEQMASRLAKLQKLKLDQHLLCAPPTHGPHGPRARARAPPPPPALPRAGRLACATPCAERALTAAPWLPPPRPRDCRRALAAAAAAP